MKGNNEKTEFEEARGRLGKILGYTDKECPNCGRLRVEKFECGKEICEKCHWCITDAQCNDDHIVAY